MADKPTLPPDHEPGTEISEHVNDYLEGLRARFNELTDRIEEASQASIDRGRAELDELLNGAAEASESAASDAEDETDPADVPDPEWNPEFDDSPIAARLREMVPERDPASMAAAAAADVDGEGPADATGAVAASGAAVEDSQAQVDDSPPVVQPIAPAMGTETEPAVESEAPRRPTRMPRPVNTTSDRTRGWVVGILGALILLSVAFLAGRWWSSRGGTETVTPTTVVSAPQATAAPSSPTDESIQAAVDAAVTAMAPSVVVGVTDGVVTLTGSVADATTRQALSSVVGAIAGVRLVDNRIDIAVPTAPTAEAIQEAADAARVETGFEHLTVTVVEGVATVTGVVGVETVGTGVFASIAPLTDALEAVPGIESIVTRVQLRGDEAALRTELKDLIDESPIIFASNSSELDAETTLTLDRAAEIIISYPGLRVLIAGHTDAAGAAEQNEVLATARGQAVLGYLISKGVPVTRLQVVSYGELFPGAGGEQSLNRRIEFEVAP